MYKLPVQEFLNMISEGLKSPINESDIFSNKIKITHLKRIDKIFEKGLHYYLDPMAPEKSKEASIFFRKDKFGTKLNIRAKKVVCQYEELKLSLSAIAKLSDLRTERKFPKYTLRDDPKEVAFKIRNTLYPKFIINRRDFLQALISKFAEYNILVFEFIESSQRKEKANIDGFYLKPNFIVLKRYQAFRREIFTLAHELGHFLLEEEEIDLLEYQSIANRQLSTIERWCNDFSYCFLIGDYERIIEQLPQASPENDYHFGIIENISNSTHLSQIALFTRLLYQNEISQSNYNKVKEDFDERYRAILLERELEKEKLKEEGRKTQFSSAKPIPSPLFISTIQTAFYEGIINEYEVCQRLNIKPDKLENYI
ncbi:MAG: ImmA/IrrE family metallo-endopeptidase [Candidatus Tenebribacter davisii]|nr:ImmA/IrrE family metallo-endopeptidase [Candidatus Tenebribacter davisii]